jgi:hypothetical protein
MAYDNTNKGILSKNDRKEKDSHPDHKGQLNVNGVEYWLSAWVKERNDGSGKFFSLSVTPKDAQAQRPAQQQQRRPPPAPAPRQPARQAASGFDDMDDDIPF